MIYQVVLNDGEKHEVDADSFSAKEFVVFFNFDSAGNESIACFKGSDVKTIIPKPQPR